MTDTNMGTLSQPGRSEVSIFQRFAAWNKQRKLRVKTFNDLHQLSDRELNDIGLHRSEIGRIAREI
ncbi:MAG: DUF1127 domain-containing protein [Roseibium sp.]|uniref:DUF1127 domain-containing protein n=1 Tax=Roseibium sp. TaxID=1936156 RepID=UPI00329A2F34